MSARLPATKHPAADGFASLGLTAPLVAEPGLSRN